MGSGGAWQAKPQPRHLPLALCSASSDSPAFPGPPCNRARRGTGGQEGASEAGAGGGAGWDQAGSASGSGNCISGSAGAPGPGLHKGRRADPVGTGLSVCGLLLIREVSPTQLQSSAGQDGPPSWVPPGSSGADRGLDGQQPIFQDSVIVSLLLHLHPCCVKPESASFQALKGIRS